MNMHCFQFRWAELRKAGGRGKPSAPPHISHIFLRNTASFSCYEASAVPCHGLYSAFHSVNLLVPPAGSQKISHSSLSSLFSSLFHLAFQSATFPLCPLTSLHILHTLPHSLTFSLLFLFSRCWLGFPHQHSLHPTSSHSMFHLAASLIPQTLRNSSCSQLSLYKTASLTH